MRLDNLNVSSVKTAYRKKSILNYNCKVFGTVKRENASVFPSDLLIPPELNHKIVVAYRDFVNAHLSFSLLVRGKYSASDITAFTPLN